MDFYHFFGWDGVIRTHAYRSQSPRPYRLATSQYSNNNIYNNTNKYKNLVLSKIFINSVLQTRRENGISKCIVTIAGLCEVCKYRVELNLNIICNCPFCSLCNVFS